MEWMCWNFTFWSKWKHVLNGYHTCNAWNFNFRSVPRYRYTPCFVSEKIPAISATYRPYQQIPAVSAGKWIPGQNTILSFFGFTITRELVSKTKLIPNRTLKLKNPKICELTQPRIAWSKPGSGQRRWKNLFGAAARKRFLSGFREWPKATQKAFSL